MNQPVSPKSAILRILVLSGDIVSDTTLVLTGLTENQRKAIESLLEKTSGRFFTGISVHACVTDFHRINQVREIDPKVIVTERAIFALCGYIEL